MEKLKISSLTPLVPNSLASSTNQAKVNENNSQLMLVNYCNTSSSLNEDAKVIKLKCSSSDGSENILSMGNDHQGRHVTFCDEAINVQTEPDDLSQETYNTNLYNIGSMFSTEVLKQKVFGKLNLKERIAEKINTNNISYDTNKPNYCKFKGETRKQPKYCSYANISWKQSLSVSMKSFFSKISLKFPQKPNIGLLFKQNVDPMETILDNPNTNNHFDDNNNDMTRKCGSTTWQHPSNALRKQRVKEWLTLHTDRLQYDPLDNSTSESNINIHLGQSYDTIDDTPIKVPNLLNLNNMTEITSYKCATYNLSDNSSEDCQDSFNYKGKTEVLVKKDSSRSTKNRKPTISEICLRRCYELNTNYRISMKNKLNEK